MIYRLIRHLQNNYYILVVMIILTMWHATVGVVEFFSYETHHVTLDALRMLELVVASYLDMTLEHTSLCN